MDLGFGNITKNSSVGLCSTQNHVYAGIVGKSIHRFLQFLWIHFCVNVTSNLRGLAPDALEALSILEKVK